MAKSDIISLKNAAMKIIEIGEKKKNPISVSCGDSKKLRLKRNFFGIWELDSITSGYIVGNPVLIYGATNSGKTTTCSEILREAQMTCRYCHLNLNFECKCKNKKRKSCVYIDTEKKFDYDWWKYRGVDVDAEDLIVISSCDADQIYNAIRDLMQSGKVDIVMIDTVETLVPHEEIDKDIEGYRMGVKQQKFNAFIRKWTSWSHRCYQNGIDPTLVLLNQVRFTIGLFAHATTPGGESQKFAAMTAIHCKKPDRKKKGYAMFKFLIEKAKGGCIPGSLSTFEMKEIDTDDTYYRKFDFNNIDSLFKELVEFDILIKKKSNSRFSDDFIKDVEEYFDRMSMDKELIEIFKKQFSTQVEVKKLLHEDELFFLICRRMLLQ